MMTIHIEKLTFDAIIGILDFERTSKQTVIVETKINYIYEKNSIINYAIVINLIENLIKNKQYRLLEDALESLSEELIREFPQISYLYLKISKPNIIKNASVALSKEWNNAT